MDQTISREPGWGLGQAEGKKLNPQIITPLPDTFSTNQVQGEQTENFFQLAQACQSNKF